MNEVIVYVGADGVLSDTWGRPVRCWREREAPSGPFAGPHRERCNEGPAYPGEDVAVVNGTTYPLSRLRLRFR